MGSKEQFYLSLEQEINKLNAKKKDNFVIDAAKYRDILSALKLKKGEPREKGAQFKQWVTDSFNLVSIGDADYVYSMIDGQNQPVAKKEELFDILER